MNIITSAAMENNATPMLIITGVGFGGVGLSALSKPIPY
jgi:hypothetical protein